MKLSEEIINNFIINNYEKKLSLGVKKIVFCFIRQNIIELFGSDLEITDGVDIQKIKVGDKTDIEINYYGILFKISEENNRILFKDNNGVIKSSIDYSHPNEVKNIRLSKLDEENQIKIKDISLLSDTESFTYVEITQGRDSSSEIGYSLKPINVKKKNKEYLELSSLYETPIEEKSMIKKVASLANKGNLRSIDTSCDVTDLLDYIPEIYNILEAEAEKNVQIKR
jgi:hypothetical protein